MSAWTFCFRLLLFFFRFDTLSFDLESLARKRTTEKLEDERAPNGKFGYILGLTFIFQF